MRDKNVGFRTCQTGKSCCGAEWMSELGYCGKPSGSQTNQIWYLIKTSQIRSRLAYRFILFLPILLLWFFLLLKPHLQMPKKEVRLSQIPLQVHLQRLFQIGLVSKIIYQAWSHIMVFIIQLLMVHIFYLEQMLELYMLETHQADSSTRGIQT